MEPQLEGKKVLMTGTTAGIGFATVRALAAEAASVVINGRGPARVYAAVREIRKLHPCAVVSGVAGVFSNAAGCAELIQAVPGVDTIVNNMGILEPKPVEKVPDEERLSESGK